MPRVPTYDNLTTSISNQPQVRVTAPAVRDVVNEQGRELAQGMQQAGAAGSRIALDMQTEANKVRVSDTMNQLVQTRTNLQVDAFKQRGRNALERESGKDLATEYDEKLKAEFDALSASLGNDAQRAAFKEQADQLRQQFRGSVTGHMVKEQETFADDTDAATISTAVDQGVLLYGDPAMREQSIGAITATVDSMAQRKGWDPKVRDTKLAEAVSPMHAGIIKSMIQSGNAEAAQAYYDANSASMSLQARAAVQDPLQRAVLGQKAEGEARMLWAEGGPSMPNDPVRLFDMERLASERISDPAMRKEVIGNLRNMAQAWNAQQAEIKAAGISGLWKLYDDGATMSQIRRSDAYLSLSDTDQHEFEQRVQSERAQVTSRELTQDQRELTRLQIKEKLADIRGTELYLTASDPNVLGQMSRTQVEALRSKIGSDKTESLLKKWDELKKPGKLPEAQMDDNDFKAVAVEMGLNAFESKASDATKATVARVRMNVEALISEQEKGGTKVNREERKNIMRRMMAAEVMLDRFGPDLKVRAALVSPENYDDVIVPVAERKLIVEALQAGYLRDPANPIYAPTQENIARMYLQMQMRKGNQ